MAYIGKLFIAGSESHNGKYFSGMAYNISSISKINFLYDSPCGNWQVELEKNSDDIVARSIKKLNRNELVAEGFEQIQRTLDILSIRGICSVMLQDPARSNIGVYISNEKSVLFYYSLLDFPMKVECEVIQKDVDGNIIQQPPPLEPIWNESFRYYRLSQSSNDLFEAYRNLFLGFEALLNEICPRKEREREKQWFKRSLNEINIHTSLDWLKPPESENTIDYIIKSQYENIRCRLFHAKLPDATLPHSHLNPEDVKQAYDELIRIWKYIASVYFNVPTDDSVITYTGFEIMIGTSLSKNTRLSFTEDTSVPVDEDIVESPKGYAVNVFNATDYNGAVRPGIIQVLGYENTTNNLPRYIKPIHRICCVIDENLFSVSNIKSGLKVSGVDRWESIHEVRLINSSQPKTEFKT